MSDCENAPIQPPALVLDASAGSIFVGVIGEDGTWLAYQQSTANALEGLFPAVDACLQAAGRPLDLIRSYIYSEGPGSVLGLRLCAMAIETWARIHPHDCRLYRYNSLQLTSLLVGRDHPEAIPALLVSDWKKGVWHSLQMDPGKTNPVEPIASAALSGLKQPLYHLPQRKGWQAPPPRARTLVYQPERLIEILDTPFLLEETDSVQLFTAGANTFQRWTPERHRATH